MRHTSAIVLYARRPHRGLVKTRLAPLLGMDGALELHRAMLLDSIGLLRRVSGETILPLVAFSEPATPPAGPDDPELAAALAGLTLLPQRGIDLGDRLQATFRSMFDRGFERVVVFGSDSPTMPPERLRQALTRLGADSEVVIGPAEDGGYYLIGARRLPGGLFEGVSWGGAGVLQQTVAALRRSATPCSLLDPCYDIDRPADLDRLRRDLSGAPGAVAPHTARFCAALPPAGDGAL